MSLELSANLQQNNICITPAEKVKNQSWNLRGYATVLEKLVNAMIIIINKQEQFTACSHRDHLWLCLILVGCFHDSFLCRHTILSAWPLEDLSMQRQTTENFYLTRISHLLLNAPRKSSEIGKKVLLLSLWCTTHFHKIPLNFPLAVDHYIIVYLAVSTLTDLWNELLICRWIWNIINW